MIPRLSLGHRNVPNIQPIYQFLWLDHKVPSAVPQLNCCPGSDHAETDVLNCKEIQFVEPASISD